MGRALILVIAVGVMIGLAWPSGEKSLASAGAVQSGEPRETVLERQSNGHFYTHAKINDKELVHFVVDTGATVVVLTIDDARRLGIPVNPAEFEVVGEGASGPVRGKDIMLDSVEVDGKRVENVPAAVLEGANLSLLGQAYLSRMGQVQMSGDYMVLK
ncbi:MAG TPA: TIGR02281 family clan AA aspartic protease [Sphingomicrobium sp.]|jgi:aspartyl protease family protein|nr:TIGR02281 family clan AA aspartic protease [Sphingomicrobium sp.]